MDSEQGSQNFLNDEYIKQTKQQRQKLALELDRVEGEIEEHQKRRQELRHQISAMDIILGKEHDNAEGVDPVGTAPEPPVQAQGTGFVDAPTGTSVGTTNRMLSVRQSVEMVREILLEKGPLHYRAIYKEIVRRGFQVPGQDPAATLLARFSRDSSIKRVASGTYKAKQR